METLTEFLDGDRLDDVAIYVADQYLSDNHVLPTEGIDVDGGVVLVVPGDEGRAAFSQGTGLDPMKFAGAAMGQTGDIAADLGGGICPDADGETAEDNAEHVVEFLFAFAEAENEDVGGLYADGDVIHAYAHCSCGVNFSHKWLAGQRDT